MTPLTNKNDEIVADTFPQTGESKQKVDADTFPSRRVSKQKKVDKILLSGGIGRNGGMPSYGVTCFVESGGIRFGYSQKVGTVNLLADKFDCYYPRKYLIYRYIRWKNLIPFMQVNSFSGYCGAATLFVRKKMICTINYHFDSRKMQWRFYLNDLLPCTYYSGSLKDFVPVYIFPQFSESIEIFSKLLIDICTGKDFTPFRYLDQIFFKPKPLCVDTTYSPKVMALNIHTFVCTEYALRDIPMVLQDNFVTMVIQSGMEEMEYGKLKYTSKKQNKKKVDKKLKMVGEQLESLNLGSRRKYTKKNFKKKLRTLHYDPGKHTKIQSGEDKSNLKIVTGIIEAIEKIIGTYGVIYWEKPIYKGLSFLLVLFRGSISVCSFNVLKSLFSMFKNEECTMRDLVQWLKDLVVNLDTFKTNKFASSFVKIITNCFNTFICPTILPFLTPVLNNSIFANVSKIFGENESVLECITNVFTYLLNGVEIFARTKSLDGFISTEMTGDELLNVMRDLRLKYNLYLTGDLEFIKNYRHYELLKELDDFRSKVSLYKKSRKGIEAKQMEDIIKETDKMIVECNKMEAHSTARIQPYHFCLTSGSGISKTHIVKLLCNAIAVKNNFPCGPEYTHYLNQANVFQSGWKNFKSIVIVDDSAAMRVTNGVAQGVSLPDWLLRGANNVTHELLGASIEEKGTLFNRSLIEGWASNSFDQQFHAIARFPSAVNRRFQMRIVGKVRPEYTKDVTYADGESTQIDYNKIPEEERNNIAPDAWLFTCYDCEIKDSGINVRTKFEDTPVEERDNDFRYVVFTNSKGEKMENIGLQTLLEFMFEHSTAFYKSQEKVLEMDSKTNNIKNYCKHGLPKHLVCKHCKLECKLHHSNNIKAVLRDIRRRKKDTLFDIMKNNLPQLIPSTTNIYTKDRLALKKVKYYFRGEHGSEPQMFKVWKYLDKSIDAISGRVHLDPNYNRFTNALLNLNIFECVSQSGSVDMLEGKSEVLSMVDAIREMKVGNIGLKISNTIRGLIEVRTLFKELKELFKNWFDDIICDVILYFLNKVIDYIKSFIKNAYSHIPIAVEGTILGAYAYTKHPLLQVSMALDYANYKSRCAGVRLFEPSLVHTVPLLPVLSDFVYNTFLRSKTKAEKERESKCKEKTIGEYSMNIAYNISNNEKLIKMEDPSVCRDFIVPSALLFLAGYEFIPSLCKSLSSLYCVQQVGYEVAIEQISEIDKICADKWYLRKAEVDISPPDVLKSSRFNELENLVMRNTFYLVDTCDGKKVTGFSICNKFIIVPTHFAKKAMGHTIVLYKVKVEDYKKPGNAVIEFNMDYNYLYGLPGDLTLVYLPQNMDHMRTKDLLSYIPTYPCTDKVNGRIYWKEEFGVCKYTDAKDIVFNEHTCNFNIYTESWEYFQGYNYIADNFDGLCGAVLLDHTHKSSQILGMHVGGNEKSRMCCATALSRNSILKGINYFCPSGTVQQSGYSSTLFGIKLHEETLHRKNPFLDTVDRIDGVELLGTIPQRFKPVSKVVYTPISEDVLKAFNVPVKWGPAPFSFNGDKRHGQRLLIKNFASKRPLNHITLLRTAVNDYKKSLDIPLIKSRDFWKKELRLLNDFEVVNGVAGKRYLGGMNMSTAFDAHMPGNKSKYAVQKDDAWYFEDFVMKQFHENLDKLEQGQLTYDMSVQMLKNEATLQSKIEVGKVRSFYMSSTITQMVIRKYLLTTCRFYCLNTPYTETCVGINPHGPDWSKLAREFLGFNKNHKLIALDLKNFDLTTQFLILEQAIELLFHPLLTVGELAQKDKNVINCIKHSLLYSIVNVNGDLVVLHGIIPSGTPVTSMLGSIVNSINYRMAFYYYNNTSKLFRECVCLRTYGDDSIANVNKAYTNMNVRNILGAWKEIGIQGTDLSKLPVSNKIYYKLNEIEFLKRKFVYSSKYKAYLAPLDEISMYKCLSCHIPPKMMSIESITGQCVDNFMFEAKFHGKRFYETSRVKLRAIVEKHDLLRFCDTLSLTYEEQMSLWRSQFKEAEQVTEFFPSGYWEKFTHFVSSFIDPQDWFEWTPSFKEDNIRNTDENPRVVKGVVVPDRTQTTRIQSGVVSNKDEVLEFLQSSDGNSLNFAGSMPEARALDNDCSLNQFLARPLLIDNFQWGNVTLSRTIDPWLSLLNNPRISNRISNYNLFRAKCKVKVLINGNGFFYGMLMMSYLPFSRIDTTTHKSPLAPLNRINMSQCPKIFIDPTLSQGGEMTLPFMYPADYIRLSSSDDERSLGELLFYQIAPLKHANQDIAVSLETVTISVYAWFEDIELLGPTVSNATGTIIQSTKEDGDVKKPVSQVCTAVANASMALSRVPVVGPYALAVEQAARTTATVASALGYCQPLNPEEPRRYQPRITDNMAVVNTTDSSQKVSLDVKQDLTIDPSIVGLNPVDELSINRIAGIESFLTTFIWTKSQAPGDLLFNAYVTPIQFYRNVLPTNVYMTAMCGAAVPFKFWTGTIYFKFTSMSSSYHRGRLAINYEPNWNTGAREDNTNYTHIVDLSETREFEIAVRMYQETQWLEIEDNWYLRQSFSTSAMSSRENWTNGVVAVYVLNELTSPNSDPTLNTDISIMVTCRAGDDFRVAVPDDRYVEYDMKTQSGTALVVPDAVGSDNPVELAPHGSIMQEKQSRVYMGEVIDSFRCLLKRYQGYARITESSAHQDLSMFHQGYPLFRGYTNNMPYTGANIVGTTIMTYLLKAFAGWRGGIRWKILVDSEIPCSLTFQRESDATVDYTLATIPFVSNAANASDFVLSRARGAASGMIVTSTSVNPCLDAELPFYSRYKFIAGKPTSSSSQAFPYWEGSFHVIASRNDYASGGRVTVELYQAAAEDFTLFCFTGWQPFYL